MADWGSPLPTRKLAPHEDVQFDPALQPRAHRMTATSDNSKVLILNVQILDSTGAKPYTGDLYIQGERIQYVGVVPDIEKLRQETGVVVIQGNGRTIMSGLGDAHTHLTWNGSALGPYNKFSVSNRGGIRCYGAASAKDRLDCVIRDAINEGSIPGPRYLANGKEIARRGGELTPGITAYADGPLEMREVIRHHADLGVDQIKLSMSGEEILEARAAQDSFLDEAETQACVDEAHRLGLRVCSHARARDAVAQCVKYGVDVIYHASYIDEATMDELEKNKHRHVVAPALNWLYATTFEAGPFGYSFDDAEQAGYKMELEIAINAMKEMHQRGITVLPGGDYGFGWTPHGTYARDLEHFVKLLDFTPMEAIIAATAGVAKLFMQEHELGKVQPGYYADMIIVDGNPLENVTILQDHSKLDMIMINGRIHKASPRDLVLSKDGSLSQPPITQPKIQYSNYITYLDERGRSPLAAYGDSFHLKSVDIQAPIDDRDILAVGKNYVDHAVEFNRSGYDSSDKTDQPTHPVIFTKRSTSIVPCGVAIYPHHGFPSTLDYEGEIGVIIGKPGFQIQEKDAHNYVWGYTIINDVTAREKQRDHKQFYLGKSPDTFCPMGPIAVPASALPNKLRVQTFVNGEKRQDATTDDLIFSIANLVKTVSEAQTIRPGDIIATGTPAGVGFGQNPASFLKSGDKVEVSVTGLGCLTNVIAGPKAENEVAKRIQLESHLATINLDNTAGGAGLTLLDGKLIHLRKAGTGSDTAVFVHGLGASTEYFTPIIKAPGFEERYTSYVYDLEGHGLSPTNISSVVTLDSLTKDLGSIINMTGASSVTLFAHSLGCLIAMAYAIESPSKIERMILMGPPPCPLPEAAKVGMANRAQAVRDKGMMASGTVDAVSKAGTSSASKIYHSVAYAAVRSSLLATNPEGYAKACTALAGITSPLSVEKLNMPILFITGDEDKTSPVNVVIDFHEKLPKSQLEVLRHTGHWHIYENSEGISRAIKMFM
ncbi:fumarylacetoacetate hydrolase [Penicillium macrosclerotiorum]|uniref:fumarylacetoacetate hydrolase n=1 Tax=Penicillium macrosclerotiorum TaxID=303699 RepID=UPI002547036C|nr:fumarylacetoacetate hydrolase [Penicillium macrosclerotiorum]KAJ5679481.1 fumarylacetoacetate hydrolase [Penicillium macrosclerotiorum]